MSSLTYTVSNPRGGPLCVAIQAGPVCVTLYDERAAQVRSQVDACKTNRERQELLKQVVAAQGGKF